MLEAKSCPTWSKGKAFRPLLFGDPICTNTFGTNLLTNRQGWTTLHPFSVGKRFAKPFDGAPSPSSAGKSHGGIYRLRRRGCWVCCSFRPRKMHWDIKVNVFQWTARQCEKTLGPKDVFRGRRRSPHCSKGGSLVKQLREEQAQAGSRQLNS